MNEIYYKDVNILLEKAFLQLEEGNWKKADIILSQVLDIQPKNPHAYLGKLMVDFKIKTEQGLVYSKKSFEDNINYQRAIRFGEQDFIYKLEHAKKENIYYRAKKLIDSKKILSHHIYVKIRKELESINKNKSPNEMIDTFKKLELLSKKKSTKRLILTVIIIIISTILIVITKNHIIPHIKYQNALKLYNDEKYYEAQKIFDEIPKYKDSAEYSNKCITNIVSDSTVVDFLHNQTSQLTYKEFIKLNGNFSKEEIRYTNSNIMPYSWKYSGGYIVNDVIEYSIKETEIIQVLYFWGSEKISQKHYSLLGQEAYLGGRFSPTIIGFALYQNEAEYAQNKENTVLRSLFFSTTKNITKECFDELVSYISKYEGECNNIEYTDKEYKAKWINNECEYTLTYTIKDTEIKYEKYFKTN